MPLPYQLLALDMDGTLLDSTKQVLPATREAIRKLAESGVAIAFCTGRNPTELTDYRRELPFIRYGSLVSGALAYDFGTDGGHDGRTLAVQPLPTDLIEKIVTAGLLEDAMVHFLCTDASVASQRDINRMDSLQLSIYQSMFDRLCTRSDDPIGYAREHEGTVLKVNLYHETAEARERTYQRLCDLDVELARAEITSVETTARGISKARGLEALCRELGITMDQVVAVGDAPNDVDALRAVGAPVVMGNATDDIKALAQLVVSDNDHNGIVDAIRHYWPGALEG